MLRNASARFARYSGRTKDPSGQRLESKEVGKDSKV